MTVESRYTANGISICLTNHIKRTHKIVVWLVSKYFAEVVYVFASKYSFDVLDSARQRGVFAFSRVLAFAWQHTYIEDTCT